MYTREDGTDVLQDDVLDAFGRHARDGAVIVSSSKPIPSTDEDGKNPPHRMAADRYREIVEAGSFVCTMEWPSADDPSPVIFGVDADGARILRAECGRAVGPGHRGEGRGGTAPPTRRGGGGGVSRRIARRRPDWPGPPPPRTRGQARNASRTRLSPAGARRRRRPPSVSVVTEGPDLAERQLRAFAAVSGGSVEVLATQDTEGRPLVHDLDGHQRPARGSRDRGP